MVQWLRLCTSGAEGMGLIPNWGSKIPHAVQWQKKKVKKKKWKKQLPKWLECAAKVENCQARLDRFQMFK